MSLFLYFEERTGLLVDGMEKGGGVRGLIGCDLGPANVVRFPRVHDLKRGNGKPCFMYSPLFSGMSLSPPPAV